MIQPFTGLSLNNSCGGHETEAYTALERLVQLLDLQQHTLDVESSMSRAGYTVFTLAALERTEEKTYN